VLLDLPSALARLVVAAVLAGLAGRLGARADVVVAAAAFGPYLRGIAALALPLPAGPFLRAATGARRPSDRERTALGNAFSLLPGVSSRSLGKRRRPVRGALAGALRSVLVVDSPDENAWVIGSTLFVSRGLFEGPHLAPVVAHEAGHLAAGDGRVALAAWWLPVRSLAWPASRLAGVSPAEIPRAGRGLHGGDTSRRPMSLPLRVPGAAVGACLLVLAGGLFPVLLRPAWAAYRRSREHAADAFAAAAGQGPALVEALAAWQVLDLAAPWWQGRSHPYVEQRIDRLQRLS